MSQTRESIIERIKKLLALATSNNAEEAASAMAMAQDLLERHRISMLELEGNNEEIHTDMEVFYKGRLVIWRKNLVMGITKLLGCHLFVVSNTDKTQSWYITGRDSDISYSRFLVSYIMVELTRIVNTYYSLYDRSYKESWLLGASYGVLDKMKESQEKVYKENISSSSLIKLNNRYSEAQDYANDKFELKSTKKKIKGKSYNSEAYKNGYETGKNLDFSDKNKLTKKEKKDELR